jgi:hypothetical protein
MATNAKGVIKTLQDLDLPSNNENPIKEFTLFPRLPAELRIKIWKNTFIPRRIVLDRHTDRPRLDPSAGALLLVNNEAHEVFVENYALAFHGHGLRGIYINYSIDILFLNTSIKALKLLLKQHPTTMSRIQWLDIRPCVHRHEYPFAEINLSTMASLQLLTVRWACSTGRQYNIGYRSHVITTTLVRLRAALGQTNQYTSRKLPILGTIFVIGSPRSYLSFAEYALLTRLRSEVERYFVLREPSPSTWERFEVDMCEELKLRYPGRLDGCFAYELE